jgi:hypothetical protein
MKLFTYSKVQFFQKFINPQKDRRIFQGYFKMH